MDAETFSPEWPATRDVLQRVATHVLAQARQRRDGLFDLEPSPGGFATPQVGPDRERIRLSGDSLVVERITGADVFTSEASTEVHAVTGSTVGDLCAALGFEPDPDFWVGGDTPPLGAPDAPLHYDTTAARALGDWFSTGRAAIDVALADAAAHHDPQAAVGRLWPEHFDYGLDLAVTPTSRCNLGAAAGDSFHPQPYLYVGPWEVSWERGAGPGDPAYWNAPFGAVVPAADIALASDPIDAAARFLTRGLEYLRSAPPE